MLLRDAAQFELAVRLREGTASLGEVFAFVSGLYFRGKLAYSHAFAAPPDGMPGSLVITAGGGLVPPDTRISLEQLRAIASVPIDAADARYREPLERDARVLESAIPKGCPVVLLGSIATMKYLSPLLAIFSERLLFPSDFVGRSDMSRGGLMLRAARSGNELAYASVAGATLHGPRPPRLERMRKETGLRRQESGGGAGKEQEARSKKQE
jgi:hypothetical protein